MLAASNSTHGCRLECEKGDPEDVHPAFYRYADKIFLALKQCEWHGNGTGL